MYSRLVEAHYVRDYIIFVRFKDDVEAEIDLRDELYGFVFEPLKDVEKFKAFRVDPECHVVVWENGADLAPEFVYERALASFRQKHAQKVPA